MSWQARDTRAERDELRRQCARRRQRLTTHSQQFVGQARELRSWKTYARQYPLGVMAVAAVAGLWMGSGPRLGSFLRMAVRSATSMGLSFAADKTFREFMTLLQGGIDSQRRSDP